MSEAVNNGQIHLKPLAMLTPDLKTSVKQHVSSAPLPLYLYQFMPIIMPFGLVKAHRVVLIFPSQLQSSATDGQ